MSRELKPAEKKRTERFEKQAQDLLLQGYQRKDLILDMDRLNQKLLVYAAVFAIVMLMIYYVIHGFKGMGLSFFDLILFLILNVVLIVVHELIHGFFFGLFCQNGFRSIEFGIVLEEGVAYCYCGEALRKSQYLVSAMMPGILLGIVPAIIGLWISYYMLYLIGMIMILGAAGDVLIIYKILTYHSEKEEVLFFDHPSEPGIVIFER